MEEQKYVPITYVGRAVSKKCGIKNLFSKILVWTLVLSIYGYVFTVFYFVWNGRDVPDSLTYALLPTILGQLFAMSTIARKDKEVEIARLQYDCECMKQTNYNQQGGG